LLQHGLPAVVEKVPARTRRMYYHHCGTPHFSQAVRQYLKQHFYNRWIDLGCAQNCPPLSPDLSPLNYHA
ncbi:hypothetical protein Cfor_09635, partial [Coptotermes formosanus]